MKLTRFALAAAIACCLGSNSVPASDYYDQPSSNDQAHPVDRLVQAPAGGYVCDDAGDEAPTCEPWRLFCQKECGWNVYGFVDAGAASNFDDFWNGPVTFPDRSDAMLNQLYLITEKTIDTGGCDWGGRADLLYGSDYIFTQATGLETRGDGSPKWNSDPFYGLALPQAYLELGYNDWSVKLGHFYTPIGYEVVPANGNFFYTHAYTMQYGEPFTHTGGLATYKYNDRTNLVIGFVNGWDNFDRDNDTGAVVGGFTWNNGDRLSISLMGIASPNEPRSFLLQVIDAPELDTNRDMYSLVISYQINDCWQYVFQHDLGYQRPAKSTPVRRALSGMGSTSISSTRSTTAGRRVAVSSGFATTTALGSPPCGRTTPQRPASTATSSSSRWA